MEELAMLLRAATPEQREDVKTILANLDKPEFAEIRAQAIASTPHLHELAQEIRAAG